MCCLSRPNISSCDYTVICFHLIAFDTYCSYRRGIVMNDMNSSYVESIIKKALEGSMTTRHAARKLAISRQYVNRLKKQYLAKGIKAFDHGNKGKGRTWKTNPGTKAKTIELYSGKYLKCTPNPGRNWKGNFS